MKRTYCRLKAALLILPIFSLSTNAQLWSDFNVDFKWHITQDWNNTSNTWGDTSALEYITFDASDKAKNVFFYELDDNSNKLEKSGKADILWDNAHMKSMTFFMVDSATGSYSTTPMMSMSPIYQNDLITRIETSVTGLNDLLGDLSLDELEGLDQSMSGIIDVLAKIQMKIITFREYQNSKISKDSSISLMILPSDVSAETKAMLQLFGLPLSDTMNTSKTEYKYGQNYEIRKSFNWDSTSKAWEYSSKDSLTIVNNKYNKTYYAYSFTGTEDDIYNTRDSMIYNAGGQLINTISQELDNNAWVNSYLESYFYTPYPGAGIKFNHKTRDISNFSAVPTKNGGQTAINLTLGRESSVEMSIFDMHGKLISKSNATYSQGSHTVPVKNLPQGNFICKISDGKSMSIVPFTTMQR